MNLPHKIVFACDNGEIELIPLSANDQKDFLKLKKNEKNLQGEEKTRYENLKSLIEARNLEIRQAVLGLPNKEAKRRYIESIYGEYAKGKENFVKQTYFSNYAINSSDFHLDVRFMDGGKALCA